MKRGFTLMEIIIALIIVGVFATLSIASYSQFLETARQKVCETNLKVLELAVKAYAAKTDPSPATLSKLESQDIGNAYAKVMADNGWVTKFSYIFVRLNTPRQAYAAVLTMSDLMNPDKMKERGVNSEVFVCPSDHTGEGISYGINAALIGNRWNEVAGNTVLIVDCNSRTFADENDFDGRHAISLGTRRIAQAITIGEISQRYEKDSGSIWHLIPEGLNLPDGPADDYHV